MRISFRFQKTYRAGLEETEVPRGSTHECNMAEPGFQPRPWDSDSMLSPSLCWSSGRGVHPHSLCLLSPSQTPRCFPAHRSNPILRHGEHAEEAEFWVWGARRFITLSFPPVVCICLRFYCHLRLCLEPVGGWGHFWQTTWQGV